MSGRASLGHMTAVSLLMVCLYCAIVVQAATQTHYYGLLDDLFSNGSYRKEVRPVTDDSNATYVRVTFWFNSVVDMDEKNQVFTSSFAMEVAWSDHWLTWDPLHFGGIEKFRYPQHKLWLPDIVVTNSVESLDQLGYNESPCVIWSDGSIQWRPSEVLQTSCAMDVTFYPFDTQKCSIIIGTWVSDKHDIKLEVDANSMRHMLDEYTPGGTWEILDTSMITQSSYQDDPSVIKVTFHLRRLSTFYVLNVLVPILLLSLTASAVFYLPADAGEKIGMSITVLLAFAVYLTIISDSMPQTSLQVSVLSVYLAMLLAVCGFSVVMSVFILHLHHTPENKKVGEKMKAVTRKLQTFLSRLTKPSSKKEDSNDDKDNRTIKVREISVLETHENPEKKNSAQKNKNDNRRGSKVFPVNKDDDLKNSYKIMEEDEEKITWPQVAKTIDNAFFFITSGFILLLTAVVMVTLIYGGELSKSQ